MRLFSSTDGTNWTQVNDWTGLTDNTTVGRNDEKSINAL